MADTNKVVQVEKYNFENPSEAVKIVQVSIPEPAEDETLVRIKLRTINPADIFSVQGVYPGFQPTLPAVPGLEGMGTVVKSSSSEFKPGQRVVSQGWGYAKGQGSWQQYICVKTSSLVPLPDNISDVDAAQLIVNPATALGMLDSAARDGFIEKDKGCVVITAASSALGHMLTRLAVSRGLKVIAVVRREEHVKALKGLGVCEVVVLDEEGVDAALKAGEAIKQASPEGAGADVVLECVGGDWLLAAMKGLRKGGGAYIYGAMGGQTGTVWMSSLIFEGMVVKGWWLSAYLGSLKPHEGRALVEEILERVSSGMLTSMPPHVFKLEDIKDALAESARSGRSEKVFLEG